MGSIVLIRNIKIYIIAKLSNSTFHAPIKIESPEIFTARGQLFLDIDLLLCCSFTDHDRSWPLPTVVRA